ncbi:MAG: transposase family protein [Ignavibacteriales bacterium]|nr:transposase family protein [Ignavibacteriales bacterium]
MGNKIISVNLLKQEPDKFRQYTNVGFAEFQVLVMEIEKIIDNKKKGRPSKLDIENQLLIFLMFINMGLTYEMLGKYFDIHPSNANRIVSKIGKAIQNIRNPDISTKRVTNNINELIEELIWKSSVFK